MTSEPLRAVELPFDVSEADIDQAIAACNGDLRATIHALLVAQAYLERELSARTAEVSRGYGRHLPLARLSDVQG